LQRVGHDGSDYEAAAYCILLLPELEAFLSIYVALYVPLCNYFSKSLFFPPKPH